MRAEREVPGGSEGNQLSTSVHPKLKRTTGVRRDVSLNRVRRTTGHDRSKNPRGTRMKFIERDQGSSRVLVKKIKEDTGQGKKSPESIVSPTLVLTPRPWSTDPSLGTRYGVDDTLGPVQ